MAAAASGLAAAVADQRVQTFGVRGVITIKNDQQHQQNVDERRDVHVCVRAAARAAIAIAISISLRLRLPVLLPARRRWWWIEPMAGSMWPSFDRQQA